MTPKKAIPRARKPTRAVGRSIPKLDAGPKVTGAALYVDDLTMPGMLHGATVRTAIPSGTLERIEFDSAIPWSEFVIVDHRDIPGRNLIALIEEDQPALVETEIRHAEEPVLLLAHEDREQLLRGLAGVTLHCRPRPAVLTVEDSLSCAWVVHAPDNVFKKFHIQQGDLEAGFRKAHRVLEGTYRTGHQEHVYIENNGMIGYPLEGGGIAVEGSLQCPYYVHKALAALMGFPEEQVRVLQTVTGGGFGGKEEYPSMIAAHAALLAHKAGRPVKLMYDRLEDLAATTKRHPSIVRHRTAVDREGKLLAMDVDVVMDGGAYVTLSPVVLSRGILHAAGAYCCPAVQIVGRVVATNTPPNGAFRGFGAPQTLFAIETHMDRIAEALDMDAVELRRRNLYQVGDIMPTGQVLRDSVGCTEVLEQALAASTYARRKRAAEVHNRSLRKISPGIRPRRARGVGLSLVLHGAGFTGSGEVRLASTASVDLSPEGRPRVLAASTEIGQGTNTMFAQVAADSLGVSPEFVEVVQPDTHRVPNSGPTVASRTCMVVGGLVGEAATELGQRLRALDPRGWQDDGGFGRIARRHLAEIGPLRVDRKYHPPGGLHWDDQTYRGDAYGCYGWACNVIELEVDLDTGEVRVLEVVNAHDVGRAIHPRLVEGQIEGGITQALGWALLEELRWKDGRVWNHQLTNYIIPTTMDTPPIRTILVEEPYVHGPFGAKGVGEIPMDGPAPAVVAAVRHATGVWLDEIPVSPERLLRAMAEQVAGGAR